MSEKPIALSRRKILAGIGAAGVASVGAGLGTSAYFSDTESFEGNTLTAGSLDMKVDWEEHYNYPQLYDMGDPTDGLDVTIDPEDPENYTAFPPGVEATSDYDPLLYVHNDDVPAYMDNTSIEAFPDEDDDGIQDEFDEEDACDVLADVGGESGGLSSDSRTENAATEPGDPLIELEDVKPGDFGEVTLSFHLCNNPGYVWMQAANVDASENGVTEPEGESEDEEEGVVELVENIQTALWYDDDCDNLVDSGSGGTTEEVDVVIVLDESGSMDFETGKFDAAKNGAKALASEVLSNPGTKVGLVSFDSSAYLQQGLTTDYSDIETAVDGLTAGGGTDFSDALNAGNEELTGNDVSPQITASGGHRSGAQKVMVFLSNGSSGGDYSTEAQAVKNIPADIYAIAYGDDADDSVMQEIASDPDSTYFFDAPTQSEVEDAFDDIGGEISSSGEEIFFQGNLASALDALSADNGIPLDGDGGDDFDELEDEPDASERGCFEPTPETNCIGFSWWLPTEVGNEVQSDTVSFDLGFYTEQCRHNDGSGQSDENGENNDNIAAT
ncbi:VWA domain-containing protein [Haloarchaeobius salinus]|uniref:VWA domain-containing protein n=1 Tax=Haloarchaeobius salinus TaxID=1198298 RepID=UPI00210F176F|nr:VWA domain-containing protein [Haloarchaeobius salinus]